jgi:putative ABC transport system substrate-binding protein
MLRRLVLAAIAAGVILCAWDAGADQSVHRIGVLRSSGNPESTRIWLDGLRKHGSVNGANLQIDYRYYQGRNEQIPALAAELVASRPEVIVALGSPAAAAMHAAAPTIPLVFVNVRDPIALGLVETMARPGGHATGFATMSPEGFMGKTIRLLREVAPSALQIAQLINSSNSGPGAFWLTIPKSSDC